MYLYIPLSCILDFFTYQQTLWLKEITMWSFELKCDKITIASHLRLIDDSVKLFRTDANAICIRALEKIQTFWIIRYRLLLPRDVYRNRKNFIRQPVCVEIATRNKAINMELEVMNLFFLYTKSQEGWKTSAFYTSFDWKE